MTNKIQSYVQLSIGLLIFEFSLIINVIPGVNNPGSIQVARMREMGKNISRKLKNRKNRKNKKKRKIGKLEKIVAQKWCQHTMYMHVVRKRCMCMHKRS